MKEKGPDEIISSCPFCPYYIITLKSHTMNFNFCHKPSCMRVSCTVCKKQVPSLDDDYEEDEEEYKLTEEHEVHFKCWEFKELKLKFEDMIQNGQQ